MPPQADILPPPRKAVPLLLTANRADGYYTELVNRQDPAYNNIAPIARGTLYSSRQGAKQSIVDQFPSGLYFCKEIRPGGGTQIGVSDEWVIWIWSSEFYAESECNADISYMEQAVAFPSFSRDYTIRRDI